MTRGRFLQFANLAVAAYIWGVYVTRTYDSPEALSFFRLFSAYIFTTLIAAYPLNLMHFGTSAGTRVVLESVVVCVQGFLSTRFYNSVAGPLDSSWSTILNLFLFSLAVNVAALIPITSDFLLIVAQYLCTLMFTYKTGSPTFVAYFGPLWLLCEAVVMSFGISQLQRCKKCRVDNFQSILGLNDAQLSYVLLLFFALLTNLLDYFQGLGHLAPLLTFPLVIPAVYAQLDCNNGVAKVLILIFFLLYTSAYHAIKIIAYQQQQAAHFL